jgi:hypothetical protein
LHVQSERRNRATHVLRSIATSHFPVVLTALFIQLFLSTHGMGTGRGMSAIHCGAPKRPGSAGIHTRACACEAPDPAGRDQEIEVGAAGYDESWNCFSAGPQAAWAAVLSVLSRDHGYRAVRV